MCVSSFFPLKNKIKCLCLISQFAVTCAAVHSFACKAGNLYLEALFNLFLCNVQCWGYHQGAFILWTPLWLWTQAFFVRISWSCRLVLTKRSELFRANCHFFYHGVSPQIKILTSLWSLHSFLLKDPPCFLNKCNETKYRSECFIKKICRNTWEQRQNKENW